MSQVTDVSLSESSAGDVSVSAHGCSTMSIEKDIVNFIQDWHVTFRNNILGVVTGDSTVSQSPGHDCTTATSGCTNTSLFGSSPMIAMPFSTPSIDGLSSYSMRYPDSMQSVDLQTTNIPDFVQRTLAFMLSELYHWQEQFEQHISKERIKMKKHYAYLVQCRLTAENEKKAAQNMLSNAISTLEAAERERKKTENERIIALQDLGLAIRRRRSSSVLGPSVSVSTSFPSSCSGFSDSLTVSHDLPLVPVYHRHCLLTPPKTPLGTDTEQEAESIASIKEDGRKSSCTAPDPDQEYPSAGDVNFTFQPAKGDTLQNPIGPYIRPPMSVEDMQRCIRCLLGKDKSLKTGNRARAFLGVPWSEIVSWDPDVLLHRGVCGIKPGSTGMASRLRMMTIIESALANQGNKAITEEIWETPTYFCERCQQRYPITVRSDEIVPTLEEYEAQIRQSLIHAETSNTDTQEIKTKHTRRRKKPAHVAITDAGVDTVSFLEASEGLVKMFDLFGSTAFSVVQSDLNGNITKVRARYDQAPTLSDKLEKLVQNEKAEKKNTATEGLMWLLRGLNFTAIALQNSQSNSTEELSASFTKSYETTLKKYHNFVVKPLFGLAMKACPKRTDFYSKLGPKEKVDVEFEPWLSALNGILTRMNTFYSDDSKTKI
ncbi:hypothetical protein Clacol_002148 [Clathrus columnatus]|uniref:Glycolipid transfer protein domain-containing protein n=1 Tax=Clathrus columnatus TaxID=1419009 RepID=A0AAV5A5T4_9AGAM|nr:hypothetical protein Clacol_002148 [Clathrus columnatus]